MLPPTGLETVDWTTVRRSVTVDGWARLAAVVTEQARVDLGRAAPPSWHPLPPEEGAVRQHGSATGVDYVAAAPIVVEVGDHIVDGLTRSRTDEPAVPAFDEVTWTRYPEGSGHITAHRDPPGVGGVIATITLSGRSVFRLSTDPGHTEWETAPGDLVLLRGNGWPTVSARCLVHEVDPPPEGDRVIVTFRHNRGGAGADWFSAPATGR